MKKIFLLGFVILSTLVFGQQIRQYSNTSPDYKKEIADITTLIKKSPDSINYYVKRADLVYRLNSDYPKQTQSEFKIKDVIPDIEKAISINPNKAALYEQRGEYKWEINKDTTGALADKSKAIELEPTNPHWLAQRGTLYAKLYKYEKSCEDYTKGAAMGDQYCKNVKGLYCKSKIKKE